MNPSYEAGVLTVFLEIEKGYVYRALRPISWCYSCRTSLAEAEIEYRTRRGRPIFVHFEGGKPLADLFGCSAESTSLLVWTTTPWSLPGNVAVAAHPSVNYAAFACGERVVLMLESQAAFVFERLGIGEYQKISAVDGKYLDGLVVVHPLSGTRIPIICADYISDSSGTGFVHVALGHGAEGFRRCSKVQT